METPSQYSMGLKNLKNKEIYPSSPILIRNLNIPSSLKESYLSKRTFLLNQKYKNTIFDKNLRPYQNSDVSFITTLNEAAGIFNQQRVGKTPTTLVSMRVKNHNKNLIIVPKSIIYQWKQEYEKWHGGDVINVLPSWNKQKRKEKYKNYNGALVINYDKLSNDIDIILENAPFDSIIVDEAHVLRNYKGMKEDSKTPQRVRAIMRARNYSKFAYALTGTPAPNKPHNICGILAFMFPNLFNSFYQTAEYYFKTEMQTNYTHNVNYKDILGFKSPQKKQELIEFLELFSIQRKRKEVMKWLPKVDHETVYLDPPKQIVKLHKELSKYSETLDQSIVCENQLTTMIALRRLTTAPNTFPNISRLPNLKFKYILDYIEDYPNTPIIITSMFASALKVLHNLIPKSRFIYGKVSAKKRQEHIEDFQNKKYNILIGQLDTIKEGVTLSKAEVMIVIDPSLTYTDNEQLADRFLPISEEEAINKEQQKIIKLVFKNTIDTYIETSLKAKKNKTDIINEYQKHLRRLQNE